ncbi:hypothetical protein ERO13_A09G027401v2 [Gossypium hirsutum]|nr:hypothetical protein ERO13_A09G027401v2 [Gossypium hirsutum]
MLGLSKSSLNHHQAWWPTICKRHAIRGQVCVEKPFVGVEAVVKHGGWAEADGVCTRQQARVWGVFFGSFGPYFVGSCYFGFWAWVLWTLDFNFGFVLWFILFFDFCMGPGKNGPLQMELHSKYTYFICSG